MRRPLLLTAAAASLLALTACTAPAEPVIHPGALVGVWTLDQTFEGPEQPFIAFVQDNTWMASDGCNRVQGTWELARDGTITTTSGPHTLMACDGAQLPLAVTMAERVEVDGDTLTVHGSYDSTVTELVRTDDPLVGPPGFPVGYWVEENTPTAPFLSISADRTFTGSDGCNRLTGSWETNDAGDTLFRDVASTRMACEGVDTWLSELALGRVMSGVMTLQSSDGTVIGRLIGR
jgi:heat shock protein HslJ